MAQLEPKIFTCLTGFTGVSALVGARVFPLILPQKTQLPAITYQRISGGKAFSLSGYSGLERPRIQVDIWAASYASAKQLAAAVIAAMRASSTFSIADVSDRDLFEDAQNIYRVSIDFSVGHKEG